jgi:hypothetical protein
LDIQHVFSLYKKSDEESRARAEARREESLEYLKNCWKGNRGFQ